MKLPKRDLPLYKTDLEVSGIKDVQYRPHTIIEEQILNMAILSDEETDKLSAVVQIVENCVDIDINKILWYYLFVGWLYERIK